MPTGPHEPRDEPGSQVLARALLVGTLSAVLWFPLQSAMGGRASWSTALAVAVVVGLGTLVGSVVRNARRPQ